MKKSDFNKGWTVKPLSREGEEIEVNLPHDAMLSEPRGIKSPGGDNLGWYMGGDYEYRKKFVIDKIDKRQKTVFEFEGVYQRAEVYINGKKAAFRPYGYTNFYVEADQYLREGENEICVVARNSKQPNSRWYTGTGIYRPVWMYTADREKHILLNGIRVRTNDANAGKISVVVKTSGKGEVKVEILDGDDIVLEKTAVSNGKRALLRLSIPEAKLWSTDEPNLYRIRAVFGDDVVEDTFGIRKLAWSAEEGLTINGEREILRGACIHHDNGIIGAVTYPEAEERRVRLLKENGYNAIRSAHNPCSKYLLDACDKLGVLVMDEYIDHWYIHKTKYDYVDYMEDWWQQDLKDMVEKDYNHPSVIMYSTGNEVAETGEGRGISWQRAMTRFLHRLDGTRPVTCGINIFFNFLYAIGMGVYSDGKAEDTAETAKMATAMAAEETDSPEERKAPVGSAFYNMLAVKLGDSFMKFGATLYPCDLKTKDAFAAMDIAGYNYGLWRYGKDMKHYPNRLILGTETFCKDARIFWEMAEDHPQIIGDFVWSGMDYIGETGSGSAEYSEYNRSDRPETCMTGGNGRIDLTGKPRAEAAYTRVAFGRDPGPFIAVKPPYEAKPAITGWQFTKALESWSFDGCDGMSTEVEVYSSAKEVELWVNGVSQGRQKVKSLCRNRFQVVYKSGKIEAACYDENGEEIGREVIYSAAGEAGLLAERETETIAPEGIGFVRLRYADGRGITKVRERHKLKARVKGGNLLGFGNACPYYDGNYTDGVTETFYGEALAVVRADEGSDTVTLTFTDEKGRTAETAFRVEA